MKKKKFIVANIILRYYIYKQYVSFVLDFHNLILASRDAHHYATLFIHRIYLLAYIL